MTIQETLTAHTQSFDWYPCKCGWKPTWDGRGAGEDQHRAHVAEVLEKNAQEREAEAVRETSSYLQRIFPRKGLVDRADILADIEIAADRIGRGLHANGREKDHS